MRMSVLLSFLWSRSHSGHHVELTHAGANVSDPQQKKIAKNCASSIFMRAAVLRCFEQGFNWSNRQCFLVGLYNVYNVPFEHQSGARAEEIEAAYVSSATN
jgi:hypothetical protein